MVEGVNSTNVTLTWNFSLDPGAALQNVFLKRVGWRDNIFTALLSRIANNEFSYLNKEFVKEYRANVPSELVLLDVNEDEEYTYYAEVASIDGLSRVYIDRSPITVVTVYGK